MKKLLLCLGIFLFSCSNSTTSLDKKGITHWVAVGNSITWHPINENWGSEHGMAASCIDKDYVHVLNNMLKEYNPAVSYKIAWLVDWETNHSTYNLDKLEAYFDGNESFVIIRLGENVTKLENYEEDFTKLIQRIKILSPRAKIIVTDIFMSASKGLSKKNDIQKRVSLLNGCTWVPINQLDVSKNRSKIGTSYYSVIGDSCIITNQTVADHPGDKGMEAIAKALFNSL